MKAMIAISLDETEQACTLDVVDGNGAVTKLHAAGGQVHIAVKDGDTLTLSSGKPAAKPADKPAENA
jgi:hypothetical protein